MEDKWLILLAEFRRLGGILDNVCLKEGDYGRGVFSIDPNQKSKIFTPSKLFIKKTDIDLKGKKLRVINDHEYDREIIDFFNFYQDNFAWGSGSKQITENFEKGLSEFHFNLKKLIKKNFLVDLEVRHKGLWSEIIKKQFLNSRAFIFKKDQYIAPIWELVNHKVQSLPFITTSKGISTPNYLPTTEEITHSYGNSSPIQRFFSHGFFAEETIVFSIPFSINIKNTNLKFCCTGNCLKDDSIRVQKSTDKYVINGFPVADLNNPTLPIYYLEEIIRKIGDKNLSKEILFKIKELNIKTRKKILNESNNINTDVSDLLSKVLSKEINLIYTDN